MYRRPNLNVFRRYGVVLRREDEQLVPLVLPEVVLDPLPLVLERRPFLEARQSVEIFFCKESSLKLSISLARTESTERPPPSRCAREASRRSTPGRRSQRPR